MTSLLAGVDRATFATALGDRLRHAGLPVTLRSMTTFADGLATRFPATVDELYWTARLTLVARHDEVADFDRVFDAAFRDAVLPLDPNARRQPPEVPPTADEALAPVALPATGDETGTGLPWHTLPRVDSSEQDEPAARPLPDPLPEEVPPGPLNSFVSPASEPHAVVASAPTTSAPTVTTRPFNNPFRTALLQRHSTPTTVLKSTLRSKRES